MENCTESHAVIATIAREFISQDPFIVWETGKQIRNWTYVGYIAEGTIRAAERIEDSTAINLGMMERISVIDAANAIIKQSGYQSVVQTDPAKSTGPYNRVADNTLAESLLDWTSKIGFYEGLKQTLRWYDENHNAAQVAQEFEQRLKER